MNEATWTGVAMALIALASSAFGYVFGWLKERDKLRFDARLLAAEQSGRECDEKHAATEKKLAACEEKHEQQEQRQRRTESELTQIRAALGLKPKFEPEKG